MFTELEFSPAANLVPCSDMSGLIVKTGSEVKGWKSGDRVCVNSSPLHIYGDVDKKITDASYGAIEHGVLTENSFLRKFVAVLL